MIAALLATIVLMLGVYDVVALPGCESCHNSGDLGAATAASPHAKVDCRSCHVAPDPLGRVAFALRQPFHMYIRVSGAATRDRAAVPDDRCVTCHQGLSGGTVSRNGLRIAHASCAVGAACSDCHSSVAHGKATSWVRTYTMDGCLACHVPEKNVACDLCHEGRGASGRISSGSFAITHGPQWQSTHGMGDSTTCMVCHPSDDCVQCHGSGLPHDADFFGKHGDLSAQPEAKCDLCHEQSFCESCHGIVMPHPQDFTKTHANASKEDRALCERCHAESDCTTCHEMHVHPGGAIGSSTTGGGS